MKETQLRSSKSQPSFTKLCKLISKLKMLSHKMLFSIFKFNMTEAKKLILRKRKVKVLQLERVRKKTLKLPKKKSALFLSLISVRWNQLRSVRATKLLFQFFSCLSNSVSTKPTLFSLMKMLERFNTLLSVNLSFQKFLILSLVIATVRNPTHSRRPLTSKTINWNKPVTRLLNNQRK